MTAALDILGVTASYGTGSRARQILTPLSLSVQPGESVAVVGASGVGKSTLASIVLGLRAPDSGAVRVEGSPWIDSDTPVLRSRRALVQGVAQDPGASFVPHWSIRRSVTEAIRRLRPGSDPGDLIQSAAELAHLDGALIDRRPHELSGGQAQRAAIMRALAVSPAVLVADEPTSALDPATATSVTTALLASAAESRTALLLVTHDPDIAARCDRTATLTAP